MQPSPSRSLFVVVACIELCSFTSRGHEWQLINPEHDSAIARHQHAIGPSAKPNETNSLARRERRDDRVSGWVEGRDLGSVPRLTSGLDVERDRSCCADVDHAWRLGEHTFHCRTIELA
mgnify:FL=1